MTFLELFLLFSSYTFGFIHLIVGVVGVITGTPLVYRMPYLSHRLFLYVLVLFLLFLGIIREQFGTTVSDVLCGVIICYLVYEIVRPFMSAVITVVGSTVESVASDIERTLQELSVPFKGEYPMYTLIAPYGRLKVRYHPAEGIAELKIKPYRRKALLDQIGDALAVRENKNEFAQATRGYLVDILFGLCLIGLTLWRAGTLL